MKITKTKRGKYTTVIWVDGRSQRFTATTKPELTDMVRDYQSRVKFIEDGASTRFGDALSHYISAREAHRSPYTIAGYKNIERALREHHAAFCGLRCDRIRARDVQAVMDECRERGLSEKTMRNWSALINSVLAKSGGTPARLVLPPRKVQDRPIPSVGEVRMMLCLMHGTALDIPFQLALLGMRRGEVCALDAKDIDGDGVAHIHCAMALSDRAWIVKDTPKTSASNRYVQLPRWLADRIAAQGYVTHIRPNSFSESYRQFLAKYKFPPYRLHDCRHFFASYAHEQGVPEADILAAAGWASSYTMRRVYRHAMSKNRAGATVSAALWR